MIVPTLADTYYSVMSPILVLFHGTASCDLVDSVNLQLTVWPMAKNPFESRLHKLLGSGCYRLHMEMYDVDQIIFEVLGTVALPKCRVS